MNTVPVIDLAPARTGDDPARRAVAGAIDAACREIGFFAIRGHGVPAATVDALRARAHDFFARPLAEKLAMRHPVAGTNRGYHQVGGETLAAANDAEAPSGPEGVLPRGAGGRRPTTPTTGARWAAATSCRISGPPRPPASRTPPPRTTGR